MGQSPFAKRSDSQEPGAANRRSTRVDYVCPIILSGWEAAGKVFREKTETSVVNLHGCRLRTTYQVLVGMLVVLECPKTGMSEKAICVRVWEPPPGETAHDIAVQLLKPQNLWGIERPPADWQRVAETMVHGLPLRPLQGTAATTVPDSGSEGLAASPKTVPAPASVPVINVQLAELEQRSAQIMESVLQIVRNQTEEVARDSVEAFRQQVEILVRDAEGRIRWRAEQSYDEMESWLTTLRADLAEQLAHRTEQIVASVDEVLREKVGELFATLLKSSPGKPAEPTSKK